MVDVTFGKLRIDGRRYCVVGSDLANYQGVWISNRTQQTLTRIYTGSSSSNTSLRIGMPSRLQLSVTVV